MGQILSPEMSLSTAGDHIRCTSTSNRMVCQGSLKHLLSAGIRQAQSDRAIPGGLIDHQHVGPWGVSASSGGWLVEPLPAPQPLESAGGSACPP